MTEADGDGALIGRTRHGELSLDDVASMQMGLARLMREYSDRFWACYYAAQGGNWPLATYMLNNIRKLHEYGGKTRPKMKPWLDQFEAEHIRPLTELTKRQDWAAFEPAYHAATDAANALHQSLGYPYIYWTLPPEPPPHLRMVPDADA